MESVTEIRSRQRQVGLEEDETQILAGSSQSVDGQQMRCPKCSRVYDASARFCKVDGAPLESMNPTATVRDRKPGKEWRRSLIGMAVAIAVGGVVYSGAFWSGGGEAPRLTAMEAPVQSSSTIGLPPSSDHGAQNRVGADPSYASFDAGASVIDNGVTREFKPNEASGQDESDTFAAAGSQSHSVEEEPDIPPDEYVPEPREEPVTEQSGGEAGHSAVAGEEEPDIPPDEYVPVKQSEPKPATVSPEKQAYRNLVRGVQGELNRIGYAAGPADGVSGPRTRQAIRAYQTAENITVDGRVSQSLLSRLRKKSPGHASAAAGAPTSTLGKTLDSAYEAVFGSKPERRPQDPAVFQH